jgi:hypothetical protein
MSKLLFFGSHSVILGNEKLMAKTRGVRQSSTFVVLQKRNGAQRSHKPTLCGSPSFIIASGSTLEEERLSAAAAV